MSDHIVTLAAAGIAFTDLGLSPVALSLGFFELRWYSLAYLAGIFLGYWYLLKLLKQPGAPMARRHADDLVFYASLGIIFGGRLGYVLFYNLPYYLEHPIDILKLWDGGMSFHGGVIGTSLGILYLARREGLQWLRLHDYVACTVPFGLFFGRLANFVNAELWGAPTNVPWAVRFPEVANGLRILAQYDASAGAGDRGQHRVELPVEFRRHHPLLCLFQAPPYEAAQARGSPLGAR